jgi:hypothetical protein
LRHNHAYGLRRDRTAAPSERCFTRLASSIRSTVRKSARPRAMTTSGSGPTRSVHCGGTDHTVTPSSCSKTRSPYRLYRLPTQGSCRPNSGWNGCVTRTNCNDRLEESAFSVEVQAAREGSLRLAAGQRRKCVADGGTVIDVARGDRLEATCVDRTSANRDPSLICVHLTQERSRKPMEANNEHR